MHTTNCMKQCFTIDTQSTAALALRVQLSADKYLLPHLIAKMGRETGRMIVPSACFPGGTTNRYKRNAASVRYDVGYNPKAIALMCKPAFRYA